MEEKRCAHCGCPLDLNPRSKNQRYCGKKEGNKECQRARKRMWQKSKMATDLDYSANQKDCNRAWREKNPNYWRDYRRKHPECAERNRLLQRGRRRRRRVAKMDASEENSTIKTGTYWLIPEDRVAKMDAFTCKILLIPVT
jgi:hypothetical protein